jgi:hypothetical protein
MTNLTHAINRWLSIPRGAAYIGVAIPTLHKMLLEDESLRAVTYQIGKRLLFNADELEAWLNAQRLGGPRRGA